VSTCIIYKLYIIIIFISCFIVIIYLFHYANNVFYNLDKQLGIEDLRIILKSLFSARVKWLSIGVNIGVDYPTLKAIEREQHERCDDCLREMLGHRLAQSTPLTWADLCAALREESVDKEQLAHDIELSVRSEILSESKVCPELN